MKVAIMKPWYIRNPDIQQKNYKRNISLPTCSSTLPSSSTRFVPSATMTSPTSCPRSRSSTATVTSQRCSICRGVSSSSSWPLVGHYCSSGRPAKGPRSSCSSPDTAAAVACTWLVFKYCKNNNKLLKKWKAVN